jgi:C1A family cysteine protease
MRSRFTTKLFTVCGLIALGGWLMASPTGAADEVPPIGFGAVLESPSPEKLLMLHNAAVTALQKSLSFLPLTQNKQILGTKALPTAAPSDPVFSWHKSGYVTPAQDQKHCGSCFVFAAVAAIESNWALRNNKAMIQASEQHVLNCVSGDCAKGGILSDAMIYLVKSGTCTKAEEPYLDHKENKCSVKPVRYQAEACEFVDKHGRRPPPKQIKKALLAHGPIAAFIYAEGLDTAEHRHSDAVISDNPPDNGSNQAKKHYHFVLIVGWDDNKTYPGGKGAWEIKNSWGPNWGQNGFAYVAYNKRSIGDNAMWIEVGPGMGSRGLILQNKVGLQ